MISICILNLNRVGTLKKTFKILQDLKIENEIIVFDQNSSDGSVEFLKAQKNTKLIASDRNVGNSVSRNNMIRISKYDYVVLLDSDIVPITNSIEELYNFITTHTEFSFLGYDFHNFSSDEKQTTRYEKNIKLEDIITGGRIALTQYGIFRKKDLLKCPFPEFYPFNQEGWGAEDDLVGMAINDSKLGTTGKIIGRTYLHNHQKSSWQYIKDEVPRLYALRYIIYRYFDWFLTPDQKVEALISNTLPVTKLDISKYFWEIGNNFGDVATDWVWQKYFPFFKLSNKSDNLLFFGGSILDHYPNARQKYKRDFKKLILFGVGIYDENTNLPTIEYEIYPRGLITKTKLENRGISCKHAVGDVLQLLALLPLVESDTQDTLIIQDVFCDINIEDSGKMFRISEFEPYKNNAPFLNLERFIASLKDYSKIVSSQVHPFFYYICSGKEAKLIVKDIRAGDLKFFKSLKFESKRVISLQTRKELQNSIPEFIDSLFSILKVYK